MKKLKDFIHSPPVWVNPRHPVKVAVALMQSLGVDVLPVLDSDQVVGMVTAGQMLGVPETTLVSEVMHREVLLLSAEMPVREAAAQMSERGVDVAFVINDTLSGMIHAIELIAEVSRSYDPLTKLPWQDALREWSIEKLRTGHEISILFFDIDNFGQFNKQYDHVTGDRVLELVARTIERELDPDLTLLCRYGGDEFAVSTLYMLDEAQHLASRIARRVEELQVPKVRETVSVSYGVFGGRRTREREMVHYAATVDDLITRASRLCLQMKQRKGALAALQLPLPGVELEEQGEPRVRVTGISFVTRGKDAEASVELALGNTHVSRQAQGDAKQPPEMLMVQAARDALIALLPNIGAIHIHHVSTVSIDLHEKAERMEGVMVVVEWQNAADSQLLSGFAPVRGNVYRSAVNALLHALNRALSRWLSRPEPRVSM
ncbi:MAG: hypothetical protein C4335_11990 [Armatimonadota bacterium]